MLLNPYDTETTGIPDWHTPSDDPCQPHIVQLAAKLIDDTTRETIEQMDVIIRPDGWEIPQETIDVHGITMEKAMDVGIPEQEALEQFLAMNAKCDLRIGHNQSFDQRLIRIAQKRYLPDFDYETWKKLDRYCTMYKSKKPMGVKKTPSLIEAYTHFYGEPPAVSHDAMADVDHCMAVYWKLNE